MDSQLVQRTASYLDLKVHRVRGVGGLLVQHFLRQFWLGAAAYQRPRSWLHFRPRLCSWAQLHKRANADASLEAHVNLGSLPVDAFLVLR